MALDFMMQYPLSDLHRSWAWVNLTDADKRETKAFVNGEIAKIERYTPITLSDYSAKRFYVDMEGHTWKTMNSSNPYWTNEGLVDWDAMDVGDTIAWTCFSGTWVNEIWFIKMLARDEIMDAGGLGGDYQVDLNGNPIVWTPGRGWQRVPKYRYQFGYVRAVTKHTNRGDSDEGYVRVGENTPSPAAWNGMLEVKLVIAGGWQTPSRGNIYGSKGLWKIIRTGPEFINWVNQIPFSEKT